MSGSFLAAARAMLLSRSRGDLIEQARRAAPGSEDERFLRRTTEVAIQIVEDELAARRIWAARIREEFGKYHDHSSGGECGACGAIQAANWMDPDYSKDGPGAEPFDSRKGRQP